MQQVRVIVWFIAAVVVIAAGAALTSVIVPTSSGSRMLVTDCRPIPEKTSIERDSSGVPIPRRLVIRCGADEVPLVDKDAKVTDGNAKGALLLEVEDLSRLRVHPEQVVFECTMESYSIPLFFDVLPRIEFNHYTFCAPRGKWPRGTARGLEARVYPGPFLFHTLTFWS